MKRIILLVGVLTACSTPSEPHAVADLQYPGKVRIVLDRETCLTDRPVELEIVAGEYVTRWRFAAGDSLDFRIKAGPTPLTVSIGQWSWPTVQIDPQKGKIERVLLTCP